MLERLLNRLWYQKSIWAYFLLPLSLLFYFVSRIRSGLLQKQPIKLDLPVIVVGNISVGGTGKTPLIVALCEALKQQGFKPAVISRGYGGRAHYPYLLTEHSTAEESGDEPLLIYRRCQCPVVVCPKRLDAAQYVIKHCDADVILSDDGLQHYALPRDIEIVVIDGKRGLGNGFCLPAGPLRETARRLKSVDYVIVNGQTDKNYHQLQYPMQIQTQTPVALTGSTQLLTKEVHAVAAIGNPERFYDSLEKAGFLIEKHSFADHQRLSQSDLCFSDNKPVVMTEKDAVKYLNMTGLSRHWYLPIHAILPETFISGLITHLKRIKK